MPRVTFEGSDFDSDGASLLDALTARGHAIPHSCRAGACQCCLMQVRSGAVPARAQQGLTAPMVARGLFLACQCVPEQDLEVARADGALALGRAQVGSVTYLNGDIVSVRMTPEQPFDYRAGQFLRVYKDEEHSRNYSLASVPGEDAQLEIHVRHIPGGRVSGWICNDLKPGDAITISEPRGTCFYTADKPAQNLLLLATGSGLGSLYGIARDALRSGHAGQVHLYHGSRDARGTYLAEALEAHAAEDPRFHFHPCVEDSPARPAQQRGRPLDLALRDHPDLGGWRVYLCGNPQMVEAARVETFLAGAASAEIFADSFVASASEVSV